MKKLFKIKHLDFEKVVDLRSNLTTVNSIRSCMRAVIDCCNLDPDNIYLELYDGQTITYKTIQTRQGLGGKLITLEELFLRGGKIFH